MASICWPQLAKMRAEVEQMRKRGIPASDDPVALAAWGKFARDFNDRHKALQNEMQLAERIAADGQLEKEEIEELRRWLRANKADARGEHPCRLCSNGRDEQRMAPNEESRNFLRL
jgi:hypothetical protein